MQNATDNDDAGAFDAVVVGLRQIFAHCSRHVWITFKQQTHI